MSSCPSSMSFLAIIHVSDAVTTSDRVKVVYSYTTKFEESDVAWASRWDAYLKMNNPEACVVFRVNGRVSVIFLPFY